MFQDDFNEERSENPKDGRECRKVRVRSVDFSKVETRGQWLTHSPFEMEVREKLAGVPSAADLLVRAEEQRRERKRVRQKMSRLLLKAGLTARQEECYKALFVEALTVEEAAKKMGVIERRIRRLHKSIMDRLQATAIKISTGRNLGRLLKESGTRQERSVWHLHYRRSLSAKQIAKQLQISERRVYRILDDLRAKIADA